MVRPALAIALFALALTACSKPTAPDKEQPPEPQASASARGEATPAGAIQAPLQRARDTQGVLADAHAARDAHAAGADAADAAAP